ncbi:MAG: phosphatase PAP2 family protein [bacterium]
MKYYRLLWVELPRVREKVLWAIVVMLIGFIFHFMPEVEIKIFQYINGLHVPWLDTIMLPIGYLGDGVILVVLIIALGLTRGWKEMLRAAAIVILAGIIVQTVKHFYDTPRPAAILANIHTLGPVFKNHAFPSGHTAGAFAFATYLSQKVYALKLEPWLIAGLVGLSRIYVGGHFLGDVIVGAGVGYLVAVVVMRKDYIWPKI